MLVDEVLFKTQHGIVDQSLCARMGAEPTNGDGFGLGWYGTGEGPGVYRSVAPAWADANLRELAAHLESPLFLAHVRHASEGRARSLFASADVDALRRLHPDNPRFQRLSPEDRLIVSEPFSDLPGVWEEVPQATAVTVRHGGSLEQQPFRPRPPAAAAAQVEMELKS